MAADEHLGDQFKYKVLALGPRWEAMMSEHTLDPETHTHAVVPIEQIREGDLVRPTWGDYPYEESQGPAQHDKGRDDPDIGRHFLIPYARKFSPHMPEGTPYNVIRRKDPDGGR